MLGMDLSVFKHREKTILKTQIGNYKLVEFFYGEDLMLSIIYRRVNNDNYGNPRYEFSFSGFGALDKLKGKISGKISIKNNTFTTTSYNIDDTIEKIIKELEK